MKSIGEFKNVSIDCTQRYTNAESAFSDDQQALLAPIIGKFIKCRAAKVNGPMNADKGKCSAGKDWKAHLLGLPYGGDTT